MGFKLDPRVEALTYEPQNFRDIAETEIGKELWEWLRNSDNIIRMETASYLGRAAVEPLGPYLVKHFGQDIAEDRLKQTIGHMVRQIMEALGYEHVSTVMRISPGLLFTTGSRYQHPTEKRDRSMKITREQRLAWLEKTAQSPFNQWLNAQVCDTDGKLIINRLYVVAQRYGIEKPEQYSHLNPGQQRMTIGNRLRKKVNPEEYGG